MRVEVDDIILNCAVRYALGRHSYIVGTVIDEVKSAWDALTPRAREVIERDIREHVTRGDDWELDLASWTAALAWIEAERGKPT